MINTISTLFKLPSMRSSFVCAGRSGVHRQVKRLDILETAYPEVEKYLESNELIFTSFWNSKDSKEARINLVKAMIKHNCAGLGIMPALNLNDVIDQEILDLGDKYSFPIIYVSSNSRWSDIIQEFYEYSRKEESDKNYQINFEKVYELIYSIDSLQRLFQIPKELNEIIGLSTLLLFDKTQYSKFNNKESFLRNKAFSIAANDSAHTMHYSSQLFRLDDEYFLLLDKSPRCKLGIVIKEKHSRRANLNMLYQIMNLILKKTDNLAESDISGCTQPLNTMDHCYVSILIGDHIEQSKLKAWTNRDNFFLYEVNDNANYYVLLKDSEKIDADLLYDKYSDLIHEFSPHCFIFSDKSQSINSVQETIDIVLGQYSNTYELSGVFTTVEIQIIYMISVTPYYLRSQIYKVSEEFIDLKTNPINLNTLRLYTVLKNINNVSKLLGIHPNTVKYRIQKCLKDNQFGLVDVNPDMWSLNYLLPLEMINIDEYL